MSRKLNFFNGKEDSGVNVDFKGKSRWLKDEGFTLKDQEDLYEQCLLDVFLYPGFYLDNLENLREFKVDWGDYNKTNITKPHKFCNKKDKERESFINESTPNK